MDLTLLSNLAMFSLVIGTIPAYLALIKERNDLKGFSLLGVIGIFMGQLLFTIFFFLSNDYLTTILAFPLVVYWILVLYFLIKTKIRRREDFLVFELECFTEEKGEEFVREGISMSGKYYCFVPLLGRIK